MINWGGTFTLFRKELLRFLKVSIQTILTPVVTVLLYLLVFSSVLSDRLEEAEKIFTNLIGYISPLGLLSEEVEPGSGRLIGNFPQAFSHVGFINSALYLGIAKGRKYTGPAPLGMS